MKKRMLGFKNRDNYFRHLLNLFNIQCSQFVYEGLPDTLPSEFIEFYLAINGTIAIGKVKELGESSDIYTAIGSYNGNYNGYLPQEYTAAVLGLGEISGKWYGADKSIVVGKNNTLGSPEFDIPFTADVLKDVDISEHSNIIFSRLSRIPIADNDKQKAALESSIKSIIEGDVLAVSSRGDIKKQFEEFIETGRSGEGDKFLDLVDPDKINNLQYLNQYRDNVTKRFLARRGYMIQTTSKLAQQTNAEIHGSDSYALLYPLEQLRAREKMCNDINTLFGLSVSVRFNDILAKVYKDYFTEPEAQTAESSEDVETDPEVNDTEDTTDGGAEDEQDN